MTTPHSLSQRDRARIWHPFTQEKRVKDIIPITRGEGSYVMDEAGQQYLDLISSWWVNLHGHAHPQIARAIYDQAQTLEHVIFAGFTHTPAVDLCEGLSAILPKHLSRFFFSDNGSTAIEVALKMAYQYWANQGRVDRRLFISFEGGYHGDTFGAMSVGQQSGFHDAFQKLFFEVKTLPYPHTWDDDLDVAAKEQHTLHQLKTLLEEHHANVAALIIEPLMQGASGMRMCRPSFMQQLIACARSFGVLVIFDEVMTGFGRTGRLFATDHLDISKDMAPDFICVSKGITGGFLPLALTVTTETIYEGFLHEEWRYAFAHGHSYTANPLACAAACASLKLTTHPDTQRAWVAIEQAHREGTHMLQNTLGPDIIGRVRILGTISAFDVLDPAVDMGHLKEAFHQAGLLLRPLGRTVYMMPPYCTTKDKIGVSYDTILQILQAHLG